MSDRRPAPLRRRLLAGAGAWPLAALAQDGDAPRERLLREIDLQLRASAAQTGVAGLSEPVRSALRAVPRERFVPAALRDHAFDDRPLPIGEGQTISQPTVVALMTELLAAQPAHRLLEVGPGSGYQAAVLAECVARVYSIEIVPALGARAAALLRELGYRNIELKIGDGYRGWPEAAPFDGIVVTAAPDHVPQPLIEQLKPGGRLVIPVGPQGAIQHLLLIRKDADGRAVTRRTIDVRFVPLTREW
ncbi:MAG: protein-L-isoaspartate(D-aspartate) O-methyltransferase [Betaproteobacteria bacterium]